MYSMYEKVCFGDTCLFPGDIIDMQRLSLQRIRANINSLRSIMTTKSYPV